MVFTDIEGSTRLLEQLGVDAYREALAEHRRIVRDACARHSGYEVDYEGDAFFYAFATAREAVSAVSEAMTGLDGGPIRIRVGIHTGQPGLDPPGYIGLDVHRAARMMACAHGGQVVLSPTTVALLEPDSVTLKHLGEHRLKDLTAPIPLQQLQLDGLSREFPPLKTLYRTNLPVPTTPFLGREHELAAVTQRLTDPDTRLLTLTGPGGTGKTRLALQAAAEAADQYPDGVTWVALASVRDPELFLPTVATALDVTERADETLTDTLVHALRGRRTLIVLDNLEHLLPHAAVVLAEVIDPCPTLTVVVTSRERLGIAAEVVWQVPTLSETDGASLFLDRARAAGVELEVDETVRELCARLDELPLAIQLAAARTRSLSPAAILERLDQRLALLTTTSRDVDERQRTLEATIDWSYDLLSEAEQRVFCTLGVFVGGCTLAAAETLTSATLDDIESLLDKSLLRHRIDQAGQDRYWMLETVREYAASRLNESGEAERVRRAAARYFAEHFGPLWRAVRHHDADVTATMEADLDNLRASLATGLAFGDDGSVAGLLIALHEVWLLRGLNREALRAVEEYMTVDRDRFAPGPRIESDHAASEIFRFTGEFALARELKLSSVELARRFPDAKVPNWGSGDSDRAGEKISVLLTNLVDVEIWVGDLETARGYAQEAVEMRRASGDKTGIAFALDALAYVEEVAGEFEQAARCRREAADLMEEAGSHLVHEFRVGEADVELLCGRRHVAAELLVGHLPAGTDTDDTQGIIAGLQGAVYVLCAYERHADAAKVAQTVEDLFRTTGMVLPPSERERFDAALAVGDPISAEPGSVPPTPSEALAHARAVLGELIHSNADVPQPR
jgi:predicted ATPase